MTSRDRLPAPPPTRARQPLRRTGCERRGAPRPTTAQPVRLVRQPPGPPWTPRSSRIWNIRSRALVLSWVQHKEVRSCGSPSSPERRRAWAGRWRARWPTGAGRSWSTPGAPRRSADVAAELARATRSSPSPATSPIRPTGPSWSPRPHGSGGLDLLVNNASTLGASPAPRARRARRWTSFRRTFEVNVVAPLALVQAALTAAAGRRRHDRSTSRRTPASRAYEGWGGYGVRRRRRSNSCPNVLAAEEPGVRVYWVDPGDMRTEMHQDAFPGEDISDRPPPDDERARPADALLDERPRRAAATRRRRWRHDARPPALDRPALALRAAAPSWRRASRPRRAVSPATACASSCRPAVDEPVHATLPRPRRRSCAPGDLRRGQHVRAPSAAVDAVRRCPTASAIRGALLDRAARRRSGWSRCAGRSGGTTVPRPTTTSPAPCVDLAGGGHRRPCWIALPGSQRLWLAPRSTCRASARRLPGRAHGRAHPLPLRRPALAHRRLPDRLRHRAGQRRDAERGAAVHARGHHARLVAPRRSASTPILLAHRASSSLEAHELPYPERYRVPAATAAPRERHPRRRRPGRRGRHDRGARAGDRDRRARHGAPGRGLDRRGRHARARACGRSTGSSPAGTSPRHRTC